MTSSFACGQSFTTRVNLTPETVRDFANFSGDKNPIHLEPSAAQAYGYARPIAHGAILVSALSRLIGMEVPGPGAVWMSQSLEWLQPVFVGDTVDLTVTISKISDGARVLYLQALAVSSNGTVVMKGSATVKIAEPIGSPAANGDDRERVALVTGGSRGIGAATARHLALSGCAVAINYRASSGAAQAVVEQITAAGGRAHAFQADLDDPMRMAGLVAAVEAHFGRLDVFVHNATPPVRPVKLESLTFEDCMPYLRVFAASAVQGVHAALPGMRERSFGRLIFMGTSWMLGMPPAGWAPYVMAKEALWGLVKALAVEAGPYGVTANMVSPGITVTELTDGMPARAKEVEARRTPARRLATPEDTAALITFLASRSAGFINGANLPVTGGPI